MKGCAIPICKTRSNEPGISFHRFPVEKKARDSWLLSCGFDPAAFDSDRARICSRHFIDDDYVRDLKGELLGVKQRVKLKDGVVPHLNLVEIKLEPIYLLDDFEVEGGDETAHASTSAVTFPPSPKSESGFDNTQFGTAANPPSNNTISAEMIPLEPIPNSTANTTATVYLPVTTVSSSNVHYVPSSLPASQNWPGQYNFQVSFNVQEKNTKGVTWTYSKIKDKLYVGKDVPCPVNFSANTTASDNVSVRVMALYGSPEHTSEIVHRCLNHSMEELENHIFEAEHLVRCESKTASYKVDPTTQRHSVVVPFEFPAAGQHYSTYIYRFACFGSCAGGPNRRPIMLIFTLEKDGQVVGRRRLDVKICACPGRDRNAEEKQLLPKEPLSLPTKRSELEMVSLADTLEFTKHIHLPPPKKPKHSHHDRIYVIKTDSLEEYNFLLQMKKFYEMCKAMNSLPPNIRTALPFMHPKKHHREEDSN